MKTPRRDRGNPGLKLYTQGSAKEKAKLKQLREVEVETTRNACIKGGGSAVHPMRNKSENREVSSMCNRARDKVQLWFQDTSDGCDMASCSRRAVAAWIRFIPKRQHGDITLEHPPHLYIPTV